METQNRNIVLMFAQSESKQVYFHNPRNKLYNSVLFKAWKMTKW